VETNAAVRTVLGLGPFPLCGFVFLVEISDDLDGFGFVFLIFLASMFRLVSRGAVMWDCTVARCHFVHHPHTIISCI